MKTLRKKYFIKHILKTVEVVSLGYTKKESKDNAYYAFDRSELRQKVIESAIYSEEQLKIIEKEGCNKIIGNSLCVSPFSNFRYFLSFYNASEIIKGLKILMEAVASDTAEMILPKNHQIIIDAYENHIKKSPNLYLKKIIDHYPVGMTELLMKKLKEFKTPGKYYPGKDGVLLISIEKLFKLYMYVEEPDNVNYSPLQVIAPGKNLFVWVDNRTTYAELFEHLNIEVAGFIVEGDLLNGQIVMDINTKTIDENLKVFIVNDTDIDLVRCILCGRCRDVCPVNLHLPHAMKVLNQEKGILPFDWVKGCIACGLCGYFCPGWSG